MSFLFSLSIIRMPLMQTRSHVSIVNRNWNCLIHFFFVCRGGGWNLMGKMEETCNKTGHPAPPPLPSPATTSNYLRRQLTMDGQTLRGHSSVSIRTKDMWELLFDEGYRADVRINTDKGGSIYAHANILVRNSASHNNQSINNFSK